MDWRAAIGNGSDVGLVALKALLLYVSAVVGLRLSHRRTLAEMTGFDFVAAVAVGAIVGRVPNADGTTYLAGLATLLTVLLAHALLTRVRLRGGSALLDHPPKLLVADGAVLPGALRASGLTLADLHALLRAHGVYDLSQVRYVVLEQRGSVSVVPASTDVDDAPVLAEVLRTAQAEATVERPT